MPQIQMATPLEWPTSRIPTERLMRQHSPNLAQDMQEQEAMVYLQDEINNMPEISAAVLTANAMNLTSPMPTQYTSKNVGACLRITIDQKRYFIACDKWHKLAHNLYVLHLVLRQLRQLNELGVGETATLMAGFSAQYAMSSVSGKGAEGVSSTSTDEEWRDLLGLGANATLDDANAVYRQRAMKIGEGDPEALQALNIAIQNARHFLQ